MHCNSEDISLAEQCLDFIEWYVHAYGEPTPIEKIENMLNRERNVDRFEVADIVLFLLMENKVAYQESKNIDGLVIV